MKCSCLCKKGLKNKYEILNKCKEIIDDYLQINFMVKKFMEFENLKKLILTENQRKLMKYQFQYLNFENHDKTIEYLNNLENLDTIQEDIYDDNAKQIDVDLKAN